MPLRRQGWRGRCVVALVLSAIGLGGASIAASAASAAVRPQSLADALQTEREDTNAPGAQAAVVVCGRVMWAGKNGVIDLGSERELRNTTRSPIASSTKNVTATMIMQRIQAGALTLDTPVAKYYPNLPNASKITVRMLLRNRSGLRDYDGLDALRLFYKNSRHDWKRDQIVNALSKTKPLFPPDAKFKYTNSNWIVLGGILEKVTPGQSIQSYFRQNIAAPKRADMRLSTWTWTPGLPRVMAHAYENDNGDPVAYKWINGFGPPTSVFGEVFTDGGLVSTATDLARFGNALFEGKLLRPDLVNQMTDVRGNANYGFGTVRNPFDGRSWFGHDGSYEGYESEVYTDRARHVTIAVTSNMDATAGYIWEAVARTYDQQAGRGPTSCPR